MTSSSSHIFSAPAAEYKTHQEFPQVTSLRTGPPLSNRCCHCNKKPLKETLFESNSLLYPGDSFIKPIPAPHYNMHVFNSSNYR